MTKEFILECAKDFTSAAIRSNIIPLPNESDDTPEKNAEYAIKYFKAIYNKLSSIDITN